MVRQKKERVEGKLRQELKVVIAGNKSMVGATLIPCTRDPGGSVQRS